MSQPIADETLPKVGPNKLMQALEDYDHMAAEVAHLRVELKQYVDIANKVNAENEALKNQIRVQGDFFNRQISVVTAHRDRLERMLKGWLTRVSVIEECFEAVKREAREEAIKEDQKNNEITTEAEAPADAVAALRRLALHDPNRRLPEA